MRLRRLQMIIIIIVSPVIASSQDTTRSDIISINSKLDLKSIEKKLQSLEKGLEKNTRMYLARMQMQEQRLYRKIYGNDSTAPKDLSFGIVDWYATVESQAKAKTINISVLSKVYTPKLDSLATALNFLEKFGLIDDLNLTKTTLTAIKSLDVKLNQLQQLNTLLLERRKQLVNRLTELGNIQLMRQLNKSFYYFEHQLNEYRKRVDDPKLIKNHLLKTVLQLPVFRKYFDKHSELAMIFRLPNCEQNDSPDALAGLQTRAMLSQMLIEKFGVGTTQMFNSNMQPNSASINQFKSQLNRSLSFDNSSKEEVLSFKPNSEKTKPFFKRFELGTNFQYQRSSNLFPLTGDIGLSIGYKLSAKAILGIGGSYKLGFGHSWKEIKLSHQGIGLRSFIDVEFKGFWITGGYERNFKSEIKKLDQLYAWSAWQESGMLGFTRKNVAKGKFFGKTGMSILWDFLSYSQIPKTSAINFRIGYTF